MPYLLPHEDLFAAGVAALIVALLAVRAAVARRRGRPPAGGTEP